MMRHAASVVLAIIALSATARAETLVPEPEGYRTEDYRAPVPDTLAAARVITTAEAEAIWRAKSGTFIDVLPRPPSEHVFHVEANHRGYIVDHETE